LHSGSGAIVRQSVAYTALTARSVRIRLGRPSHRHPGPAPEPSAQHATGTPPGSPGSSGTTSHAKPGPDALLTATSVPLLLCRQLHLMRIGDRKQRNAHWRERTGSTSCQRHLARRSWRRGEPEPGCSGRARLPVDAAISRERERRRALGDEASAGRFDRAREFFLEGSERPEIQQAWRRECEAARARGEEPGFWDPMAPGTALIVRTFLRGQERVDHGHDVQ
jgi:hypothetical protein